MQFCASIWHPAVYIPTEDQLLSTPTAANSPARDESPSAPTNDESPTLLEMHAWVKDQGLEVHHACLPEPTAYTVIESTDPDPAPRGKTMLFLGEKGKNQAWARF
jgi:hypothetical protein